MYTAKFAFISSMLLAVACQQNAADATLASLNPVESGIFANVQGAMKSPNYKAGFAVLEANKVEKFASFAIGNTSDHAFTFNGKTYANVKTKLGQLKLKTTSSDSDLQNLGDVLGSQKITGSVSATDAKAFVKFATASLDALQHGETKLSGFDAETSARALRVSMILTAARLAGKNLDLNGSDPLSLLDGPLAQDCLNSSDPSLGCVQDGTAPLASIGGFSAGSDQWIDDISHDSYPACQNDGNAYDAGQPWSTLPDGRSCHRLFKNSDGQLVGRSKLDPSSSSSSSGSSASSTSGSTASSTSNSGNSASGSTDSGNGGATTTTPAKTCKVVQSPTGRTGTYVKSCQ